MPRRDRARRGWSLTTSSRSAQSRGLDAGRPAADFSSGWGHGARTGFTLVELLVVVAIIAVLISMLMPSLRKAHDAAIRVRCASQLHQIGLADVSYTSSNQGYRPYRKNPSLPHQIAIGSSFDLNKTFFTPYLSNRGIMFCPSRLLEARYPGMTTPADYAVEFVTYQYHNMPVATWLVPQPRLDRVDTTTQAVSLWSCLSLSAGPVGSGPYFGHDDPITRDRPEGLNAAFTDGSVRWANLAQMEFYWTQNSQWYWWAKP